MQPVVVDSLVGVQALRVIQPGQQERRHLPCSRGRRTLAWRRAASCGCSGQQQVGSGSAPRLSASLMWLLRSSRHSCTVPQNCTLSSCSSEKQQPEVRHTSMHLQGGGCTLFRQPFADGNHCAGGGAATPRKLLVPEIPERVACVRNTASIHWLWEEGWERGCMERGSACRGGPLLQCMADRHYPGSRCRRHTLAAALAARVSRRSPPCQQTTGRYRQRHRSARRWGAPRPSRSRA